MEHLPPELELHLLGPFRLLVNGEQVDSRRWSRRKAKQLIKLLALETHHQLHREQLMELLWPEASPDAAANNLHKTIHAARRALEPGLRSGTASQFIFTEGQQVILRASGGLRVDAIDFELQASAALRSGEPEQLEAVLALYEGDLLVEDLYEDWAAARREQLRSLSRDLSLKLARLYEARGFFDEAIARLKQILIDDPMNEELHRSLMRIHALSGNRHQALQQFAVCREALRREMEVEPERATIALRDRIESGQLGATRSIRLPRTTDEQSDSLAVLPLVDDCADAEFEYLSDGFTESIINSLSRLARLRVRGWSTVARFKQRDTDPVDVGRRLGVRAVLTGRVFQRGNVLRISAELLDVSDGSQMWGEQYNRSLTDILAVQEEISAEISEKLLMKLSGDERHRLAKRKTENVGAYHAYLRGRYHWNKRTEEALRKSIECFNEAIDVDPSYAAAYHGISDSYALLALRGVIPHKEAFLKAKAAARRALEIDGTLAEAYASLAHVQLHDWDWPGLKEKFLRALDLNPGHAIAYNWYAEYLRAMGQADESIAIEKRAEEIDPLSAITGASLGTTLHFARMYDRAVEQFQKAIEINPNHFLLHLRLGLTFLQKGRHDEAIEEMQKAANLSGRSTEALAGLGQAYAAAGMQEEVQKVLDELILHSTERYVSPYNVAKIYAALGDREEAFSWLEKAYVERQPDLIELQVEPVLDTLRGDRRFQDLLRGVGLAESASPATPITATPPWESGSNAASPDRTIDSIAVIPLLNHSGDAELDYLSDGITEGIISSLSELAKLKVMAWTTVSRYKGREIDPHEVAGSLGVRALLTGRVLELSDRVVIKVELVDAADGSQLWGGQYNREYADILAIQEEISAEISRKLLRKLSGDEQQRLAKRKTENVDAYHAYLRGRYHWNKRTAESLKRGVDCFKQAIDLDPCYAAAYAGLSDSYTLLVIREALTPEDGYEKAKAAARMGLRIDEGLGEAHASLAHAMLHNWEWTDSERKFKRALELNPGYPSTHHWYSEYLCATGRFDEAIGEVNRARELDPLSLIINAHFGDVLYFARRYEESITQSKKVLELDSSFGLAHDNLAKTYRQMRRYEEAIAEQARARELLGDTAEGAWLLGCIHASAGNLVEARAALDRLLAQSKHRYISPYGIALVYAALGEKDLAFEWLERAYTERCAGLFDLNVEPKFDPLRSDPRFADILSRIGFC